jgi:hypothetical protein
MTWAGSYKGFAVSPCLPEDALHDVQFTFCTSNLDRELLNIKRIFSLSEKTNNPTALEIGRSSIFFTNKLDQGVYISKSLNFPT